MKQREASRWLQFSQPAAFSTHPVDVSIADLSAGAAAPRRSASLSRR